MQRHQPPTKDILYYTYDWFCCHFMRYAWLLPHQMLMKITISLLFSINISMFVLVQALMAGKQVSIAFILFFFAPGGGELSLLFALALC